MRFPLPIIILAHERQRTPANRRVPAATAPVASAQQRGRAFEASVALPCQCFPAFGTMGRNFSKELRRFLMAGAKGGFLAKFFR
jgi:hypothetical protein